MDVTSYSNFKYNLKKYMKQVNDEFDALIVTGKDPKENIVVMSQRDYDAMQETMKILSDRYVMKKILRGDAQFDCLRDLG